MLWKININSNMDNIYFDDVDKYLYFLNPISFSFGFNVLNPYNYNTDNYDSYNYYVVELLKLYDDNKRFLFEKYINNCINNKNFVFCKFNNVEFTINKSNLNLNDYEIVL